MRINPAWAVAVWWGWVVALAIAGAAHAQNAPPAKPASQEATGTATQEAAAEAVKTEPIPLVNDSTLARRNRARALQYSGQTQADSTIRVPQLSISTERRDAAFSQLGLSGKTEEERSEVYRVLSKALLVKTGNIFPDDERILQFVAKDRNGDIVLTDSVNSIKLKADTSRVFDLAKVDTTTQTEGPARTPDLLATEDISKLIKQRARGLNRIELAELNPSDSVDVRIRRNAQCVLGMVPNDKIVRQDDGTYKLDDRNKLGPTLGLCQTEKYWAQPTICHCTAFLVGDRYAVTAKHCFDEAPLSEFTFIYGYEMLDRAGRLNPVLKANQVFRGLRFVNDSDLQNLDFVIIQLDRPALGRSIPSFYKGGKVPTGVEVHSVGYPLGLPAKVARYATINRIDPPYHFFANLDTYQGNSGSPVFETGSGKLIGILVGGVPDFSISGGCKISNECKDINCLGEKVLDIKYVLNYLPGY
jgi:V8-like Glu-specific endopeptidase